MSATVQQIYVLNPSTTIANGDLIYLVQSPYTPGSDSAIIGSDLKAMFLQTSNNLSDVANPAAARANLGLSVIATATPPLSPILGGTGINNGASTITIGGSFSMVGAFTFAGTLTGNTTVTFPTSGTLATTSQLPTFPITLAQGGTNASLVASNGGIFYSTATAGAILAGTATARQMLQSGATAAPAWSTATWPATTTANAVLFSSATNTVSEIISAASAVLITSAGSVPSFSQTLPSAVQTNITALGAQSQALNMNTHQINNLSAGVAATDAANVGQLTAASSPLTTKGDLYTFTTVNARLPVGTINGQVLQVNSAAATGLSYSTPSYPSISGTTGVILRSDGTNNVYSTSTFADTYTASNLLYSNGANTVTGLATANNGLLVTSNTGVPSILAGPGATGKILQSNAAAAPSFSTATYPSVATGTGTILRADGTNWVPSTATYPNTAGTSGNIMTSDGTNFISSTPSVVLPVGTMFNFQSTNTTTVSTITNTATMTDITGVSVAITPTSSSNKVLVRAAVQVSVSAATGVLQLVRGSTAIGIGAAAGSRTVAGAVGFTGVQSNSLVTVVMEFLDSPATTSATTYKVQGALLGGTGSLFCNQSITDTNTATFPRTSSTISVCEIKV